MNRKSSTTLTISAVAFIAALLIDLYLILVYPSMIQVIIAVSLIVVVDTYFLVDGILAKVDEIANLNLDKQNELTKVEKVSTQLQKEKRFPVPRVCPPFLI